MPTRPKISALNLCSRCLRRRLFSTSLPKQSITPGTSLPSDGLRIPREVAPSGSCRLATRALILIHGRDVVPFLHGLIAASLLPGRQTGLYSVFLNAQGRILNDVFLYPFKQWLDLLRKGGTLSQDDLDQWGPDDEGYFIECDKAEAQDLARHLKKHKLRTKVKMRVLEENEWTVWSTWRKSDMWTEHRTASLAPGAEKTVNAEHSQWISCVDTRAPGMGRRLLIPSDARPWEVSGIESPDSSLSEGKGEDTASLPELGIEAYMLRRMLRGVAEGQGEILRGSALPQECNVDFMGGVDFRKGCYLGQELTIRTHHTGVVRKRILPVQLYVEDHGPPREAHTGNLPVYDASLGDKLELPNPGSNICKVDKRSRSAGKFLGGIGNIGLGLCRLETMTNVVLTPDGPPFNSDDQFQIVAGGEGQDGTNGAGPEKQVRVKALVPDWIRNQIIEKDARK